MKVHVITGTNRGIGNAYCKHLLQSPNIHLVASIDLVSKLRGLACRNEQTATDTLAEFKQVQWGEGTTCQMGIVDIGDFGSIQSFVTWFQGLQLPLHVLINNAGFAHYELVPDETTDLEKVYV
jgi:NAD(P)-dependent dehydrogenase (short-subunit alcohol dehydrogenase family)